MHYIHSRAFGNCLNNKFISIACTLLFIQPLFPGTTGKLSGVLTDKKTGDKIPAHFIQEVVGKANNEEVITVHWGPAVSKNPYLTFVYNGSKGDRFRLIWPK